jgi:hypothetical protein
MFLDLFDVLMSKISFFFFKKYYFDTFSSEKYFESNHYHTVKRAFNINNSF